MNRIRTSIFVLLAALIACGAVAGQTTQTRTNQIFRRCSASTTTGSVQVRAGGDIYLVPCSTKSVFVGATNLTTFLSNISGLTTTRVPYFNGTAFADTGISFNSGTSTYTTTGQFSITSSAAGSVPLTVLGASGQSVDLFDIKTNGNTCLWCWNSGGDLTVTDHVLTFQYVGNTYGGWHPTQGGFIATPNAGFQFSNANNFNTIDAGLRRITANVVGATDGGFTNLGWFQDVGTARVAANATNATTTFSNLTDLTKTVIAGRKYICTYTFIASDSTAADGVKFDFSGGTATMTNFEAGFLSIPPGPPTLGVVTTTALATALTVTTATTADAFYTIHATFVVNAGGTLIPRMAQVAHSTGTATVTLGSDMVCKDTP